MAYVVHYCGEYDLDENGFVVPVTQEFETLEEAREDAAQWERFTRCIASIDYIA